MKNAYITLFSSEKYLIGVLALNESLKKVNSKNPFIVLATNNISERSINILKENNIIIKQTKNIHISDEIKNKNSKANSSNWNHTFDKLSIFSLTEYDTLIYLDSDIYIRKNIDHLFKKESWSATIDRHCCVIDKNYIQLTSGIMIIKPEIGLTEKLTKLIDSLTNKFEFFGDQDVIQAFFHEWNKKTNLHLPIIYNMFFVDIDFYMKEYKENTFDSYKGLNFEKYNIDDIYVFHFIINKKPWEFKTSNAYIDFIRDVLYNDFKNQTETELKSICKLRYEMPIKYKEMIAKEYFEILKEEENRCKQEFI